jgi:hypothetical protein
MGEACCMNGRHEKCIQNFGRKNEGMRILGRSRRRREDNIRMDLGETGRKVVDRIHLTQERVRWRPLFYVIMTIRIP